MLDENKLLIAQIKIKEPVIGKETNVEWDGIMNKGPHAGEPMPAGQFSLNFRIVPFIINPPKIDDNENEDNILETYKEQIDPNHNQD